MKKLLGFLLLFAAGVALLLWLDRRSRPEPETPPALPPPRTDEPEPEQGGVRFGGRTTWAQYDETTKNLVWRLAMRDVRYETASDVLLDVTLELHDPALSGRLQARLQAARARVKRVPSPAGQAAERAGDMQPLWEMKVELEEVQVQLVEGLPLAPITFLAPSATIDATDPTNRVLTSDALFSARSQELAIDGRGLRAELDRGWLEIKREGKVELRRAQGQSATFAATGPGPVQVRSGTDEDKTLVLEAWEGVRLELGSGSPGKMSAQHVALRARARENGEFVVERLDADGAVDWTSEQTRLRGERLGADFDSEGELVRARLEEGPSAELTLELQPGALPEVREGGTRIVRLEGRDLLSIESEGDGYRLAIEGLPSVVMGDFRLRTANRIDGRLAVDRRSGSFVAAGGVVVEGGLATLETARFELDFEGREGELELRGTASDGARLSGNLLRPGEDPAQSREFTLTTPDKLVIERVASGWRVVESTLVEVALEGKDGFQARAARVYDVDIEALAFRAEGDVSFVFNGELGRLGGDELEVFALVPVPHFVLRGSSQTPAYFESEIGRATAREVEVTGGTLVARGEVAGSARFAGAGREAGEYRFRGDEVRLERDEETELLRGERLRRLRLVVEGNVDVTAIAEGETVVVKSARLYSEYRARRVESDGKTEELELGSLLIAEGGVHADVIAADGDFTLDCERLELERAGGDERGFRQLTAAGEVRFQGLEDFDVAGECELLVFDGERNGTLESGPGGRVLLRGLDPVSRQPYRLGAERVDFELMGEHAVRMRAIAPELRMLGLRARADLFRADLEQGVVLSGNARLSGTTANQVPFVLGADNVVLVGRAERPAPSGPTDEVDSASDPLGSNQLDHLTAEGSVDFRFGDSLHARGEKLLARRSDGILRFDGAPVVFDLSGARLESDWIEYDWELEVLVATGRGRLAASAPDTGTSTLDWSVDFLSASTLLELDSVVLVIQEPVLSTAQGTSSLRATWAILWLGREAFSDNRRRDELLEGVEAVFKRLAALPDDAPIMQKLALLQTAEMSGLLREVYFEGPVEVVSEGELLARADAIYLDSKQQRGWLAGATVNLGGQFVGQRHEKLIIKTDWMRLSADGTLRADSATVTPCTYDEPHVRVVTGDLRIEPLGKGGKENYRLLLKDNRIEFYGLFSVPLPTIDVATDEELKPVWRTLSLANSARFGTLLSFGFSRPADKVGEVVNSQLGNESTKVDANYKVDGSYFGSRGGLLDFGLEVEGKDEYWLDLFLGVAIDSGSDRGFVRVDEDDRSTLRTWLRSQGYFHNGDSEWTFALSDQSDAAVQSEFFEGQFLRYERAETFLQWHESQGAYFTQATAEIRIDDFRSEVEELPSASTYRGRSPLARIGSYSLVHTGDLEAAYLRRLEGEDPRSPFALPTVFPDGLGERDVLRVDTEQVLELPVPLGGGFRLTPFVSGRGTAWSEGEVEEDTPTRVLAEGGARLGATFWKPTANGKLHQIAPFIEYRSELGRQDSDGIPVEYDEKDRAVTGDFLRLGLRQRYAADAQDALLDVDLVGTHARDRSDGRPDGWMPLEVFARFVLSPLGHEVEIFHDGRYDLENSRTDYSLVSFGTRFGAQWGLQFSHQRGLDDANQPLFEAASVSGLYRWTEKWEFEGRQSFSLLEDEGLDTRVLVRRYGHDLVFEIETAVREGEGSSLGISVKPRFGYTPPRVGYVPW